MGVAGRAGADGEVAREDVLHAGRRAFLRQERIDVVGLAGELGIARATVYRWFGNRDRFTGFVLVSLAFDTLEGILRRRQGQGPRWLADALCEMLEVIMDHPAMKAFLTSNPQRALTILTGPGSVVHEGLVERFTDLIDQRCPKAAGDLTSEDVAYALVRLAEAFCYTDLTTGRASEVRRAHPLFVRILKG